MEFDCRGFFLSLIRSDWHGGFLDLRVLLVSFDIEFSYCALSVLCPRILSYPCARLVLGSILHTVNEGNGSPVWTKQNNHVWTNQWVPHRREEIFFLWEEIRCHPIWHLLTDVAPPNWFGLNRFPYLVQTSDPNSSMRRYALCHLGNSCFSMWCSY